MRINIQVFDDGDRKVADRDVDSFISADREISKLERQYRNYKENLL